MNGQKELLYDCMFMLYVWTDIKELRNAYIIRIFIV